MTSKKQMTHTTLIQAFTSQTDRTMDTAKTMYLTRSLPHSLSTAAHRRPAAHKLKVDGFNNVIHPGLMSTILTRFIQNSLKSHKIVQIRDVMSHVCVRGARDV